MLWMRVRCEPHFLRLLLRYVQHVQLLSTATETATGSTSTSFRTTIADEIIFSGTTHDTAQRKSKPFADEVSSFVHALARQTDVIQQSKTLSEQPLQ